MTTYEKINDTEVSNTAKISGGCSALVRVPFKWLGKKVICRLAEETDVE